jgi:Fe-Mn family superoxide dismutase
MNFHYGRHHDAYVHNLNGLVRGTNLAGSSLESIIQQTSGSNEQRAVFNNAAQVWNHTFYWNSMKPRGGGEPSGRLRERIIQSFGDFKTFKDAFMHSALSIFGNGWGWLVQDGDKLRILQTGNAGTPMVDGFNPLITIDVWEHAYYLDHKNLRKNYITVFLNHLVNWEFAEKNLVGS